MLKKYTINKYIGRTKCPPSLYKKFAPFFLFFGLIFLSGCGAIGDIFKAGVWVGILLVIVVVGIIVMIVAKVKK